MPVLRYLIGQCPCACVASSFHQCNTRISIRASARLCIEPVVTVTQVLLRLCLGPRHTLCWQHCVLRCYPSMAKCGNIVACRADTRNVSEDFLQRFLCPGHKICVGHNFCARAKRSQHLGNMITPAMLGSMLPPQCVLVCRALMLRSCVAHGNQAMPPFVTNIGIEAVRRKFYLISVTRCTRVFSRLGHNNASENFQPKSQFRAV